MITRMSIGIAIAAVLLAGAYVVLLRKVPEPVTVSEVATDTLPVSPVATTSVVNEEKIASTSPVVTVPSAPAPTPVPTPAPVPTPDPVPQPEPAPEPSGITMAEVSQHDSKTSCWTVIRGSVYDVTSFISKHPGGASKILALCGNDGTSAFEGQHDGQRRPESTLATFKIGELSTN